MHTGYDHTVDWWALGVLLFHFLAGVTPFMAESKVHSFTSQLMSYHVMSCDVMSSHVIPSPACA